MIVVFWFHLIIRERSGKVTFFYIKKRLRITTSGASKQVKNQNQDKCKHKEFFFILRLQYHFELLYVNTYKIVTNLREVFEHQYLCL